jgi:glycopeptide antibiotics resistance protein
LHIVPQTMSAVNQKKSKTSQKKHCGELVLLPFNTTGRTLTWLNTYLENIRNIFSNIVIFCNGILLNVGLPHRPVALWV